MKLEIILIIIPLWVIAIVNILRYLKSFKSNLDLSAMMDKYSSTMDSITDDVKERKKFFKELIPEAIPADKACPICLSDGVISEHCKTCGGKGYID